MFKLKLISAKFLLPMIYTLWISCVQKDNTLPPTLIDFNLNKRPV